MNTYVIVTEYTYFKVTAHSLMDALHTFRQQHHVTVLLIATVELYNKIVAKRRKVIPIGLS